VALQPGIAAADELADRQRVQELIGEQQQRPWRQAATWPGRAPAWASRRLGEASTRCTRAAARKAGAAWATARSASAISVPRPGPTSARITSSGRPILSQVTAHQAPRISPKAWEISGAVVKSPARPKGLAGRA
jgi:hypothetical protein